MTTVADYPVDVAAKAVGSKAELARLCEVTPQAIQKWAPKIPAERVLDVERVSGISRHVLRPDLYPIERRA